jgi:hypothetical protein
MTGSRSGVGPRSSDGLTGLLANDLIVDHCRERKVIIRAYGLFWRADEVEWRPGSGNKYAFHLLGRVGINRPGVRVADFRKQRGVYILYNEYGAYYVGLNRKQDLAKRLRDHMEDEHAGRWDRFSWFGFASIDSTVDDRGVYLLEGLPDEQSVSSELVIADLEALLIKAIGPRNKANMNFQAAEEWTQIKLDEVEVYLAKVCPAVEDA